MDENILDRDSIKLELENLLKVKQDQLNCNGDVLKIDMHCHDRNSNRPSERLGRILGIPETWLPTEELLSCLNNNGADGLTITNHNNARSCWDLLDKGHDILVGAEFTCNLPNSNISIHVLTYGFNSRQEVVLNKLRRNLYNFLSYCAQEEILTVWAHPLYFNHNKFSEKAVQDLEHIVTLFSHFEIINGQRNSKQNLVTANWLKSFDQEKINSIKKNYSVNINDFTKDPFTKYMVGGSDDHMGIFAGCSGTYVKVDNLENRLKTETKSSLILEGLKHGNVAPYGTFVEDGKMSIALLELFYQIVKYMDDPGLIRVMLHEGKKSEKLLALGINNFISELRRHKYTLQFFKYFHKSLHGKGPGFWPQTYVKKTTKPILQELDNIAKSKLIGTEYFVEQTKTSLNNIFTHLNKQAIENGANNIRKMGLDQSDSALKIQPLLNKIELPATFRSFVDKSDTDQLDTNQIDIGKFFDKITFPALASGIIGGINFASNKVLNDNREFLNHFSKEAGMKPQEKRMLWLTDTFNDKNGIAISLNNYLSEVREKNLPIDFLVCNNNLESSEHLIVTKPLGSFPIPMYKEQSVNIPNLLEIKDIFQRGNYDRIMCSTEFMMGLVGLYLKNSFNVKANFFIHTDWLEFCNTKLELTDDVLSRITKFFRSYYRKFDKLFVLNQDHKLWLNGSKMKISENKVITTKHWVSDIFNNNVVTNTGVITKKENEKILLFVGRLSEEKGLLDFPYIVEKIKSDFGDCKAVFVGSGPLKDELTSILPESIIIDWLEQDKLPQLYKEADFLVFPSRFDTFGRVVLEAISCGCPVAAYSEKGPKDIIEHRVSGVLAKDKYDLAEEISRVLSSDLLYKNMKKEAVTRSLNYNKEVIIKNLLINTELN